MTVIAWDGKTLAADRLATSGGYIKGGATKIFRLDRGSLVGLSGGYDCCMALFDWLCGPRNPADWPAAAQSSVEWARAMEIWPGTGSVLFHERHPHALIIKMSYYAIGAGAECAVGAMAMGASAKQAVEIAIQFINCCGGDVDTLTL